LANHKGSLLGLDPGESQPSQKFFESLLWKDLEGFDPGRPIFVEAESRKVGNVHLPTPLWERITASPVTEIQTPAEARVAYLLEDYPHWPEEPERLVGRLGILRERHGHKRVDAWLEMINVGRWEDLVMALLVEHYDPSYSRSTNYRPASHHVSLEDVSEGALEKAAQGLLGELRG
jgi:tRNA 2-selenouridine synthase